MTDKVWEYVAGGVFLVLLRMWSSFEHKKTKKDVNEIKFYINGELEKKLDEAREQGRQEERLKHKKDSL